MTPTRAIPRGWRRLRAGETSIRKGDKFYEVGDRKWMTSARDGLRVSHNYTYIRKVRKGKNEK